MNQKYVNENMIAEMCEKRRFFHKYPEVGWTEYMTTYYIAEYLKQLGYDIYVGAEVCDAQARLGVPKQERLKEAQERARKHGVRKS